MRSPTPRHHSAAPSAFIPLTAALLLAGVFTVTRAAAQTVPLHIGTGDNLAISGAGTHGTYGGQPVSTSTTSYAGSPGPGGALGTAYSAGAFTLGQGGSLSYTGNPDNLGDNNAVVLTVQGGTTTVTGGTLSAGMGDFCLETTPTATSTPTVNITGGTFTTALCNPIGQPGGGIWSLGGVVKMSGGVISVGPDLRGTSAYNSGLLADSTHSADPVGVIDLFGTGFTDGNGNALTGPLTSPSNGYVVGDIKGILLNGDLLNTTYRVQFGGMIEFNVGTPPPAPEPSQVSTLGLGTLFLSGLALRARRRIATSV